MNKIFKKPTQSDIQSIIDYFTREIEPYIALEPADFQEILSSNEYIAVLECSESGEGRLSRALNAIKDIYTSLSSGGNIFNSKQFLIQVSHSNAEPLLMSEVKTITDFISKMPGDTEVTWGFAKQSLPLPHTLSLKIIAAKHQ